MIYRQDTFKGLHIFFDIQFIVIHYIYLNIRKTNAAGLLDTSFGIFSRNRGYI